MIMDINVTNNTRKMANPVKAIDRTVTYIKDMNLNNLVQVYFKFNQKGIIQTKCLKKELISIFDKKQRKPLMNKTNLLKL